MRCVRVARASRSQPVRQGVRTLTQQATRPASRLALGLGSGLAFGGLALYGATAWTVDAAEVPSVADVDWAAVKRDLVKLIESAGTYDDGSYGPLLIRLAWHSAGSYSRHDKTGGTQGAAMRFKPEAAHGGNAGLHIARQLLEPIKAKYPGLSYADLYALAGTVAIEALGGPKCAFRPGRIDFEESKFTPTPDGRLPDASQGADHVRAIFYRMGFSDQEIVALCGAHALGRCHKDRSGFEGPWTNAPTMFSNDYFRLLIDETWTERAWNGPRQFQDSSKKLMMLPSDLALLDDPSFSHWVRAYADDEALFMSDFAKAWTKLMEQGVNRFEKPVLRKLFG